MAGGTPIEARPARGTNEPRDCSGFGVTDDRETGLMTAGRGCFTTGRGFRQRWDGGIHIHPENLRDRR